MPEAIEPQPNIVTPKEHPDLYRRSLKGGYWVIAMRTILFILGFAKSIIIANFFILENLGLIAVAGMMMEVLSTFTQTGFETALIQKKGDINDYLDTAWTVGIIKGILLFLILYSAAPLLASIRVPEDKVPLAAGILRAMSLCFLINGVRNIGTIYFQKELDFRKEFTLNVVTTLANIILTLSLIYFFRSIWGVIIAQIITAAANCFGSYILSPFRPRLRFEFAKVRELWHFGKWINGQNILGYALAMGDDYFVWFYLGLPQLALYRYAYRFSTIPATHIATVIASVSFPAYSKIQNDIPRLRDAYLKTLKTTATVSIPAAFLIFSIGPDFVFLFLPERMGPMIPALQILAFQGLMGSLSATWPPLLLALGKPDKIMYIRIVLLIVLALIIFPFTKMWGIVGTACSILFIGVAALPYGHFLACKLLKCTLWTLLKQYLLPTVLSLLMSLLVIFFRRVLFTQINYVTFFATGIAAVFFYCLGLWMLDHSLRQACKKTSQMAWSLLTSGNGNGKPNQILPKDVL